MKRQLLFVLFIAFASIGACAQSASISFNTNPQAPNAAVDSRAKDETDKLNNIVQLTPDQYPQALQINRNFFIQVQSATPGKAAAKAAYGREQRLKGILTSEQWQMLQNAKISGQWQ